MKTLVFSSVRVEESLTLNTPYDIFAKELRETVPILEDPVRRMEDVSQLHKSLVSELPSGFVLSAVCME